MCKLLSELTTTNKTILKEILHRFEARCGEPGIDLHLTSEIFSKSHLKVRALGLDPHDTTGPELYRALANVSRLHDSFIAKRFHITQDMSVDEVQAKITGVAQKLNVPKSAWVLRQTVIRKILRDNPPKQLRKKLGYRSTDSMIKRESPTLLIAAAKQVESKSWMLSVQSAYRRLTAADFEQRDIEMVYPDSKKWRNVSQHILQSRHTPVTTCIEAGSIIVYPAPGAYREGFVLFLLANLIHSIKEIRMLSSYLKHQQLRPMLGKQIVDTLFFDQHPTVKIVGQDVHWRSIQRHYGTTLSDTMQVFHPHIQAEDFAFRSAEEVLYKLEPALEFWKDMDYVGLPQEDGPISFNLMDNVTNVLNHTPYNHRNHSHMQQAVWDEIYARYLGSSSIEQHAMRQLDAQMVNQPVIGELDFAL